MKAIAIINQKGGVGKTTTALALAAGLTRTGKRVLQVDLDAQANITQTLGADDRGLTVLDVLMRKATIGEAIQKTVQGDVLPANPGIAGLDTVLTFVGKEYRLKEALAGLNGNYDYVIIDTPPALGILTVNALAACDGIIVPAQADIFSLNGINQLNETTQAVREYCNPRLKILGILLTRYSARSILSRDIADVIEQTAQNLQTKLFRTTIRENIAIKEAQAKQRNIYDYAPKSNAAADYTAFTEEILLGE
jgi:chromosome partitioning protein